MAFNCGDIIRDVFAFWNRPAESDLGQDDVITITNRKINRMLLLAQLTDKNYLAILSPIFTFSGSNRLQVLNLSDLSAIVRVESRAAGNTDENNWTEELIQDYGSWNDVVDSNTNSVAFYGAAPDSYTMAVNRDPSGLEFRVLYETGGVSLSGFNDAVPVFQNLFRSTIFYGVSAEAGMQIDNLNAEAERSRDKKIQYAIAQEMQSLEDFKHWLHNEPGQSVVYRESFSSTREGRGSARMYANDQFGGYYSRY